MKVKSEEPVGYVDKPGEMVPGGETTVTIKERGIGDLRKDVSEKS